jgi:hypothetical protein
MAADADARGLVVEKTGAVVHWEILTELHLSSGSSWQV